MSGRAPRKGSGVSRVFSLAETLQKRIRVPSLSERGRAAAGQPATIG